MLAFSGRVEAEQLLSVCGFNVLLTFVLYSGTAQIREQLSIFHRLTAAKLDNTLVHDVIAGTRREAGFGITTPHRWSVRRSYAATFIFCVAGWAGVYLIYLAL